MNPPRHDGVPYPAPRPAAGPMTVPEPTRPRRSDAGVPLELDEPPAAIPAKRSRRERRLQRFVREASPPGEELVAWTQLWVSRDHRLHAFAVRTFDYAVLTRHQLLLFSTGFFSRQPRHLVFQERLRLLTVIDLRGGTGSRLRVDQRSHRPLRFELRRNARSVDFYSALRQKMIALDEAEGGQT